MIFERTLKYSVHIPYSIFFRVVAAPPPPPPPPHERLLATLRASGPSHCDQPSGECATPFSGYPIGVAKRPIECGQASGDGVSENEGHLM